MGKGLRVHHPTERNCVLLVPWDIGDGKGTLTNLHIHLDEEGDSIVSEGVWGQLEQSRQSGLCNHGFYILNEVYNPPTMGLGFDGPQELKIVKQMSTGDRVDVYGPDLQAIAQQLAPKGVKARISTRQIGNGNGQ